jgi:predicted nuclease of predicted toxin-antitoxin system
MTWRKVPDRSPEEIRALRLELRGKCKFLVDECLGPEVAETLRDLRWNTKFIGELGLAGHDDEAVFSYAWKYDRVLLTHDTDFLDHRRFPQTRNPGVIVLPGASGETASLERELHRIHLVVAPFREAYRHAKMLVGHEGEWTIWRWEKEDGVHTERRIRFDEAEESYEWVD